MRFKVSLRKAPKHILSADSDVVSCVGWASPEEVLSIGDDQQILSWNVLTGEPSTVVTLPNNVYATDMHFFPRPLVTGKKSSASEMFVMGAADGKFHLVSRHGRFEKGVDAHQGAVLTTRWSHDGSALATGGEDGQVKIWSQSGMLRSTLAQIGKPVYCLAWNANSSCLLYPSGKTLIIKSLQPSSKPLQWLAHDGLILKVSWNVTNNLIISAGEDCRYKLWDCYGRSLYASSPLDYPITSLAWTPDGELFAVGSFHTLRLCDKVGWSHSLEKPDTGSIFNLCWSSDSTQVAGACANGHVIFAHVVDRRLEWKNYEVEIPSRKSIIVRDVVDDAREKIELQSRVLRVSLSHRHLIVITSTQCLIYSIKNWNTPVIFSLQEGGVTAIIQCDKHFLLIEGASVTIYSYEGKPLCSPRWPGMRPDVLNYLNVSLSNFTFAVRDQTDEKVVYIFDVPSGRSINDGKPFSHDHDIATVALDQCSSQTEQCLAFVDKNNDVFIVAIRTTRGPLKKPVKLGVMVQCICWNNGANMLAALQEGKLIVWYYPKVVFTDRSLLPKTVFEKDMGDFGKNPLLVSFLDNQVNIRCADGSLMTFTVSPFAGVLHSYVSTSRWDDAVKLCRTVKDSTLWTCLAAMAMHAKQLNTAEMSYATIDCADKVEFLRKVSTIAIKDIQLAEMALLCGNAHEAEALLLQGGFIFRAIMLNIGLSKWDRALELAQKHKIHLDTVLVHRQRYLENLNEEETKPKFQQLFKEVKLDWAKVKANVEGEYQKEMEGDQQKDTLSTHFT